MQQAGGGLEWGDLGAAAEGVEEIERSAEGGDVAGSTEGHDRAEGLFELVGDGQLVIEGADLGDGGSLSRASFAGVGFEVVAGSEQGVAARLGQAPSIAAVAAGDPPGSRLADLDEGVEEPGDAG